MESIDLKIVTTWKWRVTFYLVGIFRTSSLGGSFSNNPERTPLRMQREEPGYIEVLQQRAGSLNIKLLIKGNQMFQVKEVSIFLCMGRHKSLGSLKSVLSYASRLSGATILYFHILSSWSLTIGSGHSMILQVFSFLSALEGWNWWCLWLPCLLT